MVRHLTNSAAAVTSHYLNSTLKVYSKALVTGCTFTTISGGSVGGATSIGIRRSNSISQVFAITVSAGASALNTTYDLSLTDRSYFAVSRRECCSCSQMPLPR